MPINAPIEYFKAEEKFKNARTYEEKISALEEMIRTCPSHKGAENLRAQLNAKLAKLKKEAIKQRKKGRKSGITKEGVAQVCLIGLPNSGKSWLLSRLTNANPLIADYPYTTKKPEIGMMDYRGVKIQLVEIPAGFEPEYMSIARTADACVFVIKDEEDKTKLKETIGANHFSTESLFINPRKDKLESIKNKIWKILDLIIVYTIDKKPMALPTHSTVRDFAEQIHEDFVRNFRFAHLRRTVNGKERIMRVGLDYELEDGDIVEVHVKLL